MSGIGENGRSAPADGKAENLMDISELRSQINEIDDRLMKDFEQRMHVALEIAKYKQAHGLPVHDPEREREVLARRTEAADAELAGYVERLYNTLFELSRSYQQQYITSQTAVEEDR